MKYLARDSLMVGYPFLLGSHKKGPHIMERGQAL